ncbi:hypothetical protein MNBD_GAMMA12-2278 [hydrothermal vent metagenome]|uniref:Uncharacterized protein n=1 Tax=hydrothermal vent metagenome TaxID=652676 RepID=A0A3B0Y7N4_9ZZZZ
MRLIYSTISLLLLSLSFSIIAQTTINNQAAKKKLMGTHNFNLHWLDEKQMGSVKITEKDGQLYIKGNQTITSGDGINDSLNIEGTISQVNKRNFIFNGKIITKVNHVAAGKDCVRQGKMTFRISGKRKYWRLKENRNPCSEVTDYVNIYF